MVTSRPSIIADVQAQVQYKPLTNLALDPEIVFHASGYRGSAATLMQAYRNGNVGVPLVLMLHPRDHYDLADLPDELAAELGVLTTHIVRHIQALPNISRAHVYRIGDGAAHLHIWLFARPQGQAQEKKGAWPS